MKKYRSWYLGKLTITILTPMFFKSRQKLNSCICCKINVTEGFWTPCFLQPLVSTSVEGELVGGHVPMYCYSLPPTFLTQSIGFRICSTLAQSRIRAQSVLPDYNQSCFRGFSPTAATVPTIKRQMQYLVRSASSSSATVSDSK